MDDKAIKKTALDKVSKRFNKNKRENTYAKETLSNPTTETSPLLATY